MAGKAQLQILVIEDSATTVQTVNMWLDDGLDSPFVMKSSGTLSGGLKLLAEDDIDVIVLDLNLPDSEGLETFYTVREKAGGIPIVIMSGDRDEEKAVTAVREGAQDYVIKGSFDENCLIRPLRFAIERSGRQRAEHELKKTQEQVFLARVVQQGLFPEDKTAIPGFDAAGRCDPAESTGGDYYDFVPMIGNKWGIVLGDVSGHGLPAALFMIGARAVLRALVISYADVGVILSRINLVLEGDLTDGRFVTLFLLCLNPEEKTLRFASAGHPGFVFDPAGNLKKVCEADNPPIGVDPESQFESSSEITLESGDLLFLHTDGLTESTNANDELYTQERLYNLIKKERERSAAEIVSSIFQDVKDFAQGAPQLDDITVVIVKCL